MSQDPNSAYGNNPQNPYGSPQDPYSNPPPQQNPYGNPPPQQNPYGNQPPQQNPYGNPPPQQNPYGNPPPQDPYSTPPQNPYGVPPQGGQYGQYGGPGYGPNPNVFTPLPLNEAVKQLPNQYIKVLTKPSAATFAEELPKASWDITWIQLLIAIVIRVVLGLIGALIASSIVRTSLSSSPYASTLSMFTTATSAGTALASIITVPLFFFINTGLQYLLAKAFGGQGSFLGQSYTNLLFNVPLGIVSGLLSLILIAIPVVGSALGAIVGLVVLIYSIVLNIFQIQASHRLTGGKATGAVLLTYLVYIIVGLLCGIALFTFFFAIFRSAMPHNY